MISANDPEDLTIKVPLLIAQGAGDTTVFPSFTEQTVSDLRGRGTRIRYRVYKGVDHIGVVQAARKATDRFLGQRLAGRR